LSEQYRFLRYYLPGSLFLIYLLIPIIPFLISAGFPMRENLVALLVGGFGISPVIGYLIYAFYNREYEEIARDSNSRGALDYIIKLDFVEKPERGIYQALLESDNGDEEETFIRRKEFLDLVFWSICTNDSGINTSSSVVEVLGNHLSNYAARIVCGLYVPLSSGFCFLAFLLGSCFFGLIPGLRLQCYDVPIFFALNLFFICLWFVVLLLISIFLLHDSPRVLREAFQLEENFVKAKKEEILLLLEQLRNANTIEDQRLRRWATR